MGAQAAAAGGKADSRVNLEVDPAVTNFSTFPPPPVNNRQEWPPGWSTAPKPPPPESFVVGNILTQPGAADEKPSTPQRSNKTLRAPDDSSIPFVCSPSNRRRTVTYPLGNGMQFFCYFFPRADACSPISFLLSKFQEMMHRCRCLSRIYLPFLRDHGLVWEEGVAWNGP